MNPGNLNYTNILSVLIILFSFILPSRAFITSPLDWFFAPNHTRGLVCPTQRYCCCPDLRTWRHGSPCKQPKSTDDSQECYKSKEWSCCQVEDDTFACTTGFKKDGKDGKYGWRSGTSENYFGIGKGALTVEEKQALARNS